MSLWGKEREGMSFDSGGGASEKVDVPAREAFTAGEAEVITLLSMLGGDVTVEVLLSRVNSFA